MLPTQPHRVNKNQWGDLSQVLSGPKHVLCHQCLFMLYCPFNCSKRLVILLGSRVEVKDAELLPSRKKVKRKSDRQKRKSITICQRAVDCESTQEFRGHSNWDGSPGIKCRKRVYQWRQRGRQRGQVTKILNSMQKSLDFMMGKWGITQWL